MTTEAGGNNAGTAGGDTGGASAAPDPKAAGGADAGAGGAGGGAGNDGAGGGKVDAGASGAAPDAKGGLPTALSGDSASKAPPAPAAFPDNWREEMAKGVGGADAKAVEKELNRLKMFSSPTDVYKSQRELEGKLSRGEFKAPLPTDPTPEQLADYRKANGIPETPDKYEVKLANGLTLAEQDRPVLDAFKKDMHDLNAPPAIVNAAVNRFMEMQTAQAAAQLEKFSNDKTNTEQTLQKEWGGEYKKNINIVTSGIQTFFGSQADAVMNAIGGDGRPLMSNPDVLKAFNMLARQANPAAGLELPAGMNSAKSVDGRITELRKMMGQDGSDYWRGPNSGHLQEEMRNLIRAREGFAKKA